MLKWSAFSLTVVLSTFLFGIIPASNALASMVLTDSNFNSTPAGSQPSGFAFQRLAARSVWGLCPVRQTAAFF